MEKKMDVVSVRLIKDGQIWSDRPIKGPKDAVEALGKEMCELDREVLCVINLKTNGVPINCNFVSMGAVDSCVAHPREILKSSILSNATTMLLMHNHPSGSLEPSEWDTMLTDRLLKLGDLIGIPLRITVGDKSLDKGMLEYKERKTGESGLIAVENGADEVIRLLSAID